MNLLTQWDPFRELEEVHYRTSRLLGWTEPRMLPRGESESIELEVQ